MWWKLCCHSCFLSRVSDSWSFQKYIMYTTKTSTDVSPTVRSPRDMVETFTLPLVVRSVLLRRRNNLLLSPPNRLLYEADAKKDERITRSGTVLRNRSEYINRAKRPKSREGMASSKIMTILMAKFTVDMKLPMNTFRAIPSWAAFPGN